jgi:hypothetical protein
MKAMARRGRLPPGQGELDLIELLRATPAHAVIGAEVPNDALQARLGAEQYARFVMEQTQRVLQLAEPDG